MKTPAARRAFGALAFLLVATLGFGQSDSPPPVRAVLEARGRQFFYAGDPFPLKISIANEGKDTVANPVSGGLIPGFQVKSADGAEIRPTGSAGVPEPSRPAKLTPNSGYFVFVDVTKIFPELLRPGRYSIRWSSNGLSSDEIVVRMIPKFDPGKEYVATVDTDEGSFAIGFFPRTAPVAVKSFIDMCNAGFYDGLTFHKILPDAFIEGGDAAGDGAGRPPFTYPAELANIPVVAGTVLMKPVSPSPPSNGSQFFIVLRPEASWTGQATVLGQIVDGLDVVRKISRLPSTQQSQKPNFRPLKEIRIRKITVREKTQVPAPGGGQ